MPALSSSPNIENVRIGVHTIIYNSVNLGNTKEGVLFRYEPTFVNVTVDKYGETPIDKVLTGERLQIEVVLAEPSIENLEEAISASDTSSGAAGSRLNIGREAGFSLRSSKSAILVLHPIRNDLSDLTEDIVLYKAASMDAIELPLKVDEQTVFKVIFEALVDETYGDGRRLGHIGLTNVS